MEFVGQIKADAYRHAQEAYPEESCGVVVKGVYHPLTNVHAEPASNFRIDPVALARIGKIDAVVHSHPDGAGWPSESDMRSQLATGVPWVIMAMNDWGGVRECFSFPTSLDDERYEIAFRPGVEDCYSHVRRIWWQDFKARLIEVPRDNLWWEKGGDLYMAGFESAGFHKVHVGDPPQPKPYDIGFMRLMGSPVPNHALVYVGDNMVSHHLPNRLSKKEPAGPWLRRVDLWVRWNDAD